MGPRTSIIDAIHKYKDAATAFELATQKYREAKSKDDDLRKIHCQQLALDTADEKKTEFNKEYDKLLHIENQRKSNRKIKNVIKPEARAGVTCVPIPARCEYETNDDTFNHIYVDDIWKRIVPKNGKDVQTWERITEKETVEQMLLRWQQLHFLQANETPLTTPSWKAKFDDPAFQNKVPHGEYQPPSYLHPSTRDVLLHLQRDPAIEEIEFNTTYEEFITFIHKSKEKTSTSPSGRYYDHYKTLLKADPQFLQTIHAILEISIQHNIILRRWRNTVTTLIEKELGSPYIHRMHVINIIEAEVQFIAKNFYITKLMRHAEKQNLITDEQYGGRSRRQAQSAVINKVLYYNLSRQMLMPAAFIDDDARACYDRIVTSLNSLECRKWDAPHKLSKFNNTFIENQTYSIRTAHGISNGTYKYSPDAPIQGSGQGIGWAGPRWLCSGDTCSRILSKTGTGMHFHDPSYSLKIKKTGRLLCR